jgi:hypothetical protein
MVEYTPEECLRLHNEGMTWPEIGDLFGLGEDAPRKLVTRWQERQKEPELESIEGLKPEDVWPDALEVLEKADRAFRQRRVKQQKRDAQTIAISKGPVGIAFVADQHFGSSGSNVKLAMKHAELIAETPGLYAFQVGDLVDSFVLQKYMKIRHNAPLGIIEEWSLVKLYLETIAPKLLGILDGNHDHWMEILTGLPVLADVVENIKGDVLYDAHEIIARIVIGGLEEWILRLRHDWPGHSQYNPYHGVMKAAKFDRPFHIGVGAHDHKGAMAATFRVSFDAVKIQTAVAVKCGTYKRFDRYQREQGFPLTSPKIVPVVVLHTEPRNVLAFDELEVAADYLNVLWRTGHQET